MTTNICGRCSGDGKCAECGGTGVNVHLNEEEPKCRICFGNGVCPECNGSGSYFRNEPEILDLGLNR